MYNVNILYDLKFDISFGDDHGERFTASQGRDAKRIDLTGKIKDIVLKHPDLRGEIDADKGTLRLVLYDTFKLMSAPGRFPHRAFLKDRHDKAFSGFEEMIRIVCS